MEESSFTIPADDNGDSELDPRIQIELEKLNAATNEINKLELELDEATKTFHLVLGETSRRLQALSKRLGACVERSRPYHEALAAAAAARLDCQKAAETFHRANKLHAAAKETVGLAEQRFASKREEWEFDANWQEVLNHAIIKVMDAEKRKAESGREHQRKAANYIAAEKKVAQLEDSSKRSIIKSRPYFDEKKLCEEQLQTQNNKIQNLQKLIADAKYKYASALRALEEISEDIHRRRGNFLVGKNTIPVGPREPGVGAEKDPVSDENDPNADEDICLQELRMRVRELALKPIDRKDPETDEAWAVELNETINKLDQLLMVKENNQQKRSKFTANTPSSAPSTSNTVNDQPPVESWKSASNLSRIKSRSREHFESVPLNAPLSKSDKSKSMMSLDVLSLARDTAVSDRESYLKAVIEDKSPSGTYTESNSEINDSPEDILMVECDASDSTQTPVIRMTNSSVSDSEHS